MGLFSYCLGGGAFLLIGAWEAIFCSSPFSPYQTIPTTATPSIARKRKRLFSSLTLIAIASLSSLCVIDSVISSVDASHRKDRLGAALQLQTIGVSSLFLFYSIVGFLVNFTHLLPLPYSLCNLIALFAFAQEFLLFYLKRKDPDGLENRYFDLLLVPISICFLSTLAEFGRPSSPFPRLGRGAGLILQGTWFVQMGFSFYTDLMAHGCALRERSRGNYTIKCKSHMDGHRSNAIATLQFNCHLALLVLIVVGLYSIVGQNHPSAVSYVNYKPLGAELQELNDLPQFTLDSDDDVEEIGEEESAIKQKPALPLSGMNGFVAH